MRKGDDEVLAFVNLLQDKNLFNLLSYALLNILYVLSF